MLAAHPGAVLRVNRKRTLIFECVFNDFVVLYFALTVHAPAPVELFTPTQCVRRFWLDWVVTLGIFRKLLNGKVDRNHFDFCLWEQRGS